MMNIDVLIEQNKIEEFAILLIDAFEAYHKKNSIDKIKNLFGDYFSEYDRIDDFMTQLKFNFFKNLNVEKQIFFSKGYASAFSKYDVNQHDKGTLYFLLDFMLYSNMYNIFPYLTYIWKIIEQKFDDTSNLSFALEILRYVASATDIEKAYRFMMMVYNSKKFHLDFAFQVLLVVAKYDITFVPSVIKKYTEMGWKEKEDDEFFDMLGEYTIDTIGLSDISLILDKFDDSTLWFIEKLLPYTEVGTDSKTEYTIRTSKEIITINDPSMNLEILLLFFWEKSSEEINSHAYATTYNSSYILREVRDVG